MYITSNEDLVVGVGEVACYALTDDVVAEPFYLVSMLCLEG